MPRKCSAEFSILSRLDRAEKGDDGEFSDNAYFNALMGIPRNLRILYGHAYQSYVWNVVASRRMQMFGLNVVAGDLVLVKNKKNLAELNAKAEAEKEQAIKNSEDPDTDDFKEDVKEDTFSRARPITAEEVAANKFDILDVVLPTPGFDVLYPENEALRNLYVEVMGKDNLDPFRMSRKVKEFSLAGSYRNVVARLENLEYYIRKYENVNEPLVRPEFELLQFKKRLIKRGEDLSSVKQILDGTPNGSKTAVIIKMQLQPSTYATMALRELIVGDTSRYGDVVSLRTQPKVEQK
ncbi:unnamed protein product [Ambrosiozyma monospora]|uniref:Unnamed protein product n=1 Tax=Ambrosiozyma monospora TaxID=43982 RepID=A0ACB5TDY4_AMBMO|nr:unnamed protein product [Ambrosiozyma monospora]